MTRDMMKENIASKIKTIAEPIAEKWGVEILDIEYVKEGSSRFLRIYIYKPDGVSIEDCENVHRDLNQIIDGVIDIDDNYYLEVSSMGYEKGFRTDREFEIFKNTGIEINLYNLFEGEKHFTGILKEHDENKIIVVINNKEHTFLNKDVAKINRLFEI
jgi:ribosome maturation factor RimP